MAALRRRPNLLKEFMSCKTGIKDEKENQEPKPQVPNYPQPSASSSGQSGGKKFSSPNQTTCERKHSSIGQRSNCRAARKSRKSPTEMTSFDIQLEEDSWSQNAVFPSGMKRNVAGHCLNRIYPETNLQRRTEYELESEESSSSCSEWREFYVRDRSDSPKKRKLEGLTVVDGKQLITEEISFAAFNKEISKSKFTHCQLHTDAANVELKSSASQFCAGKKSDTLMRSIGSGYDHTDEEPESASTKAGSHIKGEISLGDEDEYSSTGDSEQVDDSEHEIVLDSCQEVIVIDSCQEGIVIGCQEEIVVACQEETVLDPCEQGVVVDDYGQEIVIDDKQQSSLVPKEKEESLAGREDDEGSLTDDCGEESLTDDEDGERSLTDMDLEESLTDEDEERSLTDEDEERSLTDMDLEESLTDEDGDELADVEEEESLIDVGDEESFADVGDEESIARIGNLTDVNEEESLTGEEGDQH